MSRANPQPDPEIRIGICCGCSVSNLLLFRIPGVYRYRCSPCFRAETGTDHPLCRRIFTVRPVQRPDAGGRLIAPVDQFGIQSGDTPSYDGAAVAERCEQLNAMQLAPIFVTGYGRPCQCGHPGGHPPYCFEKGGGQLSGSFYCKRLTIAP